jgi:hypothetical protein
VPSNKAARPRSHIRTMTDTPTRAGRVSRRTAETDASRAIATLTSVSAVRRLTRPARVGVSVMVRI